jgi:nicotinamide mononucleotide (NMN) deamidase PncC
MLIAMGARTCWRWAFGIPFRRIRWPFTISFTVPSTPSGSVEAQPVGILLVGVILDRDLVQRDRWDTVRSNFLWKRATG